MSRVHDRDQLVAQLSRELPEVSLYAVGKLARKLLRAGATLHRLAEAQCNGDWPADNGERETAECQACGSYWVPSTLKRTVYLSEGRGGRKYDRLECQDCRTQARIKRLAAEYGLGVIFGGDPRGPVLKVIPPSYTARNAGRDLHNLEGIYVS